MEPIHFGQEGKGCGYHCGEEEYACVDDVCADDVFIRIKLSLIMDTFVLTLALAGKWNGSPKLTSESITGPRPHELMDTSNLVNQPPVI